MGLWAYGIRDVEIVLRIIERKIWQNNKARKITSWTPFQSLSNYNNLKNHLTIKDYTLIRSTKFWKITKYGLQKSMKGKQINLGLATQRIIWTNQRKESVSVIHLIYGKLTRKISLRRLRVKDLNVSCFKEKVYHL